MVAGGSELFIVTQKKQTQMISTDNTETWDANVIVEPVESDTINGKIIFSSGKLSIRWSAPVDSTVDHYEITATDGVTETDTTFTVQNTEITEITGLKSQTEYTVALTACMDPECNTNIKGEKSAQGTTEAEYWQIQGTKNGYESATKVVPVGTGSTLSYVLPYGDWAPETLQGIVKYFFNAHSTEFGIGMLISKNDTKKSDTQILSAFNPTGLFYERNCEDAGKNALNNGKQNTPTQCKNGELQMLAFQMVPLKSGAVRLFFEANQPNKVENSQPLTEIYSLDSQDGYAAEDFNPNPNKNFCSATDMVEGGDCEANLLIGKETEDNAPLTQARQQKVGYPKQDSWLWDESKGTFMVITGQDSCNQTRDGLFYGVWDGKNWNVETENGCAIPLVLDAHGPVIVHLGDTNYKLYYENYEYTDRTKNQYNYTVKPFRILYANGNKSGDPSIIDVTDWENESEAREVYFLWPDGTLLDDQEEAGLGDHVIWSPNENLETQIMYMNLGGFDNQDWKQPPVGLGMAVLINP